METRTKTITEKKIYKLMLNPMMGRCEEWQIVAIWYNFESLLQWKNSLLVWTYSDNDWTNMIWWKLNKVFQKWSELEYFNNCWPGFSNWLFDWTIFEEWVLEDFDLYQTRFKIID
jgi:hypothetical protein